MEDLLRCLTEEKTINIWNGREKSINMVLRSNNSNYDDIEIKTSDDFTIVGLYKGTLSIAK